MESTQHIPRPWPPRPAAPWPESDTDQWPYPDRDSSRRDGTADGEQEHDYEPHHEGDYQRYPEQEYERRPEHGYEQHHEHDYEHDYEQDYEQDYERHHDQDSERAVPMRIGPTGEPEPDRPAPRTTRRSRKKGVLLSAGALLLVIVVAAGVLVGVPGLADRLGVPLPSAVRPTDPPPEPQALHPAIQPLAATAEPTAAGVQAALANVTANPVLAKLTGTVIDPRNGATLWQRSPSEPLAPGSTEKLLTAAAALLSMDSDTRLTTKVVQGPDPSTAILVGGGDPTINSLQPGKDSIYWRSPHLADLIDQVRKASGGRITKVLIDQSRYSGDTAAQGWDPADIAAGNYAPIVPAMLDGGRADPTKAEGTPRTANPGGDLLAKFAQGIGASPGGTGTAQPGAKVLGQIQSAPLSDLVANMLTESDNVLAEVVGREVARKNGLPGTFQGAVAAVQKVLRANGFNTAGLSMSDCSGLSTLDKIPATATESVLRAAVGPDPRSGKLSPILDGLPIAGGTGTLAAGGRYQSGPSAAGRGWVRAKTGTLNGVNALAGLVQTKDGAVLVFAFMSNGSDVAASRPALDAIAARLRGCGCT